MASNKRVEIETRYAIVSIEPQGKRYACRYPVTAQAVALQALENVGNGVTVLRTSDTENHDGYEVWAYDTKIGWYF